METSFTPLQSLFGGSLIGLSAVLLMLTLGRIMGATGILAGVIMPIGSGERTWRAVLLLGMFFAPVIYLLISGSWPAIDVPISMPMIILGGFLVGIGVTFGSGCTSGHGVCGLARFSRRSIVAVLTFMVTTFATVYIVRHVLGIS